MNRKSAKINKTKSPKWLKIVCSIVVAIAAAEIVVIGVTGVALINDNIALSNYRALQNDQITKVTNDCNNKIASGMSANEDLTARVVKGLSNVASGNGDAVERVYLKDLSLSYCRASEFALEGIQDINGRIFLKGDYLFGTGDAPRKITSETFSDIRW